METAKYKAVVFDMDGTILDTLEDLKQSVNHILRKYGYGERSLAEIKTFVGNGIKPLILRSFPESAQIDVEIIYPEFMQYYNEHSADNTYPYKDIPYVMQALKERGVKVAIVSNKPNDAVKALADKYFSGLYDASVGEMKGLNKKPAPDEVYHALNLLGIDKSDAVYVGDSDVDLMTAKNSGLDSISVSWGFKTRAFLEDLKAKNIIDRPKELLDLIFE